MHPSNKHKIKKRKRKRKAVEEINYIKERRPMRSLLHPLTIVLIFNASIVMATLGGVKDLSSENSVEVDEIARYAVEEHNKKENALLEFVRVVKAKEQVVAGKLHHLTVEAIDGGKKKLYEAKVWVKPWENHRELKEFTHLGESETSQGEHKPGWRSVPPSDPVIKDAADHAVKSIQQMSNCLTPYELLDIVDAKMEVIDDVAKMDLLLKLKRGSKVEQFRVEVEKTLEGTFKLNHMHPEQPISGCE